MTIKQRNTSWFVKGQSYEERFGKELAKKFKKLRQISAKKHYNPNKFNHFGRKHSEEAKQKIGIATKGHICSIEHKQAISLANKGRKSSLETKRKISKAIKKLMESSEFRRKCLKRKSLSSLENKMLNIIELNNLPYKFTGHGQIFIGGKCPDFVNVNGEKIAVEVFYRRHKEQFRNGLEGWKTERAKLFNEYGWKLLFFNEIEVNEKNVRRRLLSL